MDQIVNRFARELAEAIAAAVARDAGVAACQSRARAAGYDMRVSLEAVAGFTHRGIEISVRTPVPLRSAERRPSFDVTPSDRRFLRSLRIAVDETTEV